MRSLLSGGNIDRFKRAALRSYDRGIELVPWNDDPENPVYALHEPGCDRYRTTCGGTCGVSHLTEFMHAVDIWFDSRVSCEPCPSKVVCQHVGAIVASDGFRWPDPPSAETLLRLVDAGRGILAEQGTDPALQLARIRSNYDALTTQVHYLVGGRQSQAGFEAPAETPESEHGSEDWGHADCSVCDEVRVAAAAPRPISQAARERAEAMEV